LIGAFAVPGVLAWFLPGHLEENSKAALGLHRICGASGLDSLGVQVLVFEILIDTECTNNVDSNRAVVELTSIQLFK
jgi:hypothetical protein